MKTPGGETFYDQSVIASHSQWLLEQYDPAIAWANDLPLPARSALQAVIRKPTAESVTEMGSMLAGAFTEYIDGAEGVDDILTEGIRASVDIALAVDHIKQEILGPGGSVRGSNKVQHKALAYLSLMTAWKLHSAGLPAEEVRGRIVEFNCIAKDVCELDMPRTSWMAVKQQMFTSELKSDYDFIWTLLEGESDNQAEQLSAENDQLWKDLRALQTYGVKNAVTPARGESDVREWVFMQPGSSDQPADKHEDNMRLLYNHPVALVSGTEARFKSSRPDTERQEYEKSNVRISQLSLSGMVETDDESLGGPKLIAFYLDSEGQLTSMLGANLKAISKSLGLEAAYESVRAEVLSIFFDLVTPVYVAELAEQESKMLNVHESTSETTEGKMRRLVLARRKVLELLGPEVQKAIDTERAAEGKIPLPGAWSSTK